jgi:hypothetical protein
MLLLLAACSCHWLPGRASLALLLLLLPRLLLVGPYSMLRYSLKLPFRLLLLLLLLLLPLLLTPRAGAAAVDPCQVCQLVVLLTGAA